jgi:hypothetical protein
MILSGKEMSYEDYRKKVTRITKINITENNIVVPGGHEVDHIFPVSIGYQLGLPAHVIGDVSNLQVMLMSENRKKSNKCDSIPPFIQEYMLGAAKERLGKKKDTEVTKTRDSNKGKKPSVAETKKEFMSKPKMEKVYLALLDGYTHKEISKAYGVSTNTITKVKNYMSKEIEERKKYQDDMRSEIRKHGIGVVAKWFNEDDESGYEYLLRVMNIRTVIDILNLFTYLRKVVSIYDPNITYLINESKGVVMIYDKKLKSISVSCDVFEFFESYFDSFGPNFKGRLDKRITEINRMASNWFYKNYQIRVKYLGSEYGLYGQTGHKFITNQDPLFK